MAGTVRDRVSEAPIIVGHSHLRAFCGPGVLTDGLPTLVTLDYPAASFRALVGTASRIENDDYWNEVARLAPGRTVAILYKGNQHLANFLFADAQPFDLVLSGAPHLPTEPDATIVPELAVRDFFSGSLRHLDSVLTTLKRIPECRPIVLGTPPPKGDDDRLRSYLRKDGPPYTRADGLSVPLDTVEFTPRHLRYKLWRVIQDLLASISKAHGVEYIPVPKAAMTTDGFLRDIYWEQEFTHANHAYGWLVLDTLAAHLGWHG